MEDEDGKNGEGSMETCTLTYVKQIASGNMLYGSGNLSRGSVTTQRGGMGWEVGGRLTREGTCVYLWLIHVDVWQKHHHIVIILQLKNQEKKKRSSASVGEFWGLLVEFDMRTIAYGSTLVCTYQDFKLTFFGGDLACTIRFEFTVKIFLLSKCKPWLAFEAS